MKRRIQSWLIKLVVIMLLVFMAQLVGYLFAVKSQESADSKRFHAAFFVREYESLRDQLGSEAAHFVDTQENRHRRAFEQAAKTHDLLMMARYGPTSEGTGGFRRSFIEHGISSDPLLYSAGAATFRPAEFELLGRLTNSSSALLKMEREAIGRVTGDAVETGKLMPVRGGLNSVEYHEEIEHFNVLAGKLRDLVMGGEWHQRKERGVFAENWNIWVIGVGLLQAAIVFGLLWYQYHRFGHLEKRAYHDSLTELPNRWYLDMYLDWVCSRAVAHHQVVILAFIDLNSFKPINDALGHDRGDYVLKYIAEHLKANCRSGDIATRYGGDEFVVVFVAPAHEIEKGVQRLKQLIHNTFDDACAMGGGLGFGAAVGISIFPTKATSPEMLVKSADSAMYQAKEICKTTNDPLAIVEHQLKNAAAIEAKPLRVWRDGAQG